MQIIGTDYVPEQDVVRITISGPVSGVRVLYRFNERNKCAVYCATELLHGRTTSIPNNLWHVIKDTATAEFFIQHGLVRNPPHWTGMY